MHKKIGFFLDSVGSVKQLTVVKEKTLSESDLQITTAKHDVIHLLHCQECGLWNLVLNECIAFVLVCKMVITETDVLHRAERQKRLLHRVLVNVKVYTADIDPAI